MMREIRIHESDGALTFTFWVDGERKDFQALDDTEQTVFVMIIRTFSQHFAGIEEISKVLLFNPN